MSVTGSQPWLGFLYLAGNFALGYLSAPDGSSALPDGFAGWAIVVAAAAYTVREAYEHWKDWPMLEAGATAGDVDVDRR